MDTRHANDTNGFPLDCFIIPTSREPCTFDLDLDAPEPPPISRRDMESDVALIMRENRVPRATALVYSALWRHFPAERLHESVTKRLLAKLGVRPASLRDPADCAPGAEYTDPLFNLQGYFMLAVAGRGADMNHFVNYFMTVSGWARKFRGHRTIAREMLLRRLVGAAFGEEVGITAEGYVDYDGWIVSVLDDAETWFLEDGSINEEAFVHAIMYGTSGFD